LSVRTRFAPSPTGPLHVGNARTALFNWLLARHLGGNFILRIEDTDRERSRPEFETAIQEELKWLGLDWDEGIEAGDAGPYRQSQRREFYLRAFSRLLSDGRVYYCFCSEKRLEADREAERNAGRTPRYPGRCRSIPVEEARQRIATGEPAVARFLVPAERVGFSDQIRGWVEVDSATLSDPILLRSDGSPTYNFAVVVDDIAMRITDVIRGEDHISNTPRQILLYRALGSEPPRFAHLPLVLGPDRTPLSKRHADTSLKLLREEGYPPEAVMNYLALLGWSAPSGEEIFGAQDLIREFDLSRVSKAAGVFDRAKLDWLANQHLRRTDPALLALRAAPYLSQRKLLAPGASPTEPFWAHLMDLLRESVARLSQIPQSDAVQILFDFDPASSLGAPEAAAILQDPAAKEVIRALARLLEPKDRLTLDRYHGLAGETGKMTGAKGKGLYRPIRLALTGRASGPELKRLIPLIEEGASLSLARPVPGCAVRVRTVARLLGVA